MIHLIKNIAHFLFELIFARLLMRRKPSASVRKVLVSAYTGLGHFILRTALIRKIEELYPGSTIAVIAGNSFGTEFVLKGYPTHILNEKSGSVRKVLFFLRLRKEKFDVAFLPADASPKFLIRGSILAGIPIRVRQVLDPIPVPSYSFSKQVPGKL